MPLDIVNTEYHWWLHFNQLSYGQLLLDGGGDTITLSDHQARFRFLTIIGSDEVIVPAVNRDWLIHNTGAAQVLVKTATGTGVAIDPGDIVAVSCDTLNCYST